MNCPICGRPTDPANPVEAKYRPFCSRRCADVDLGRWLTGSYVVPGPEVDEEASSVQNDKEPIRPQ